MKVSGHVTLYSFLQNWNTGFFEHTSEFVAANKELEADKKQKIEGICVGKPLKNLLKNKVCHAVRC
jgi:hypothetical protein